MRRTLFAVLLSTAVVSLPAAAQGGPMMQQMSARQQVFADSAVKHLGLDEETGKKVHAVIMGEAEKRQAAMQGAAGDRQAMMARMQELAAETEKELASLLSEAQLGQYRELRAAMLRMGGRRPGGA